MYTVQILTSIAIFLLAFVSRYFVSFRTETNFDVYGHLCFVDALQKKSGGPYDAITLNQIEATAYSQPSIWHWIVSFFNIRWVLKNQAWLNGLLDSCFITIAYILLMMSGHSQETGLWVVLMYLFTPMWFCSIALGPRISGFTPRVSSEILVNLLLMLTLLKFNYPTFILVAFASLIAFLIFSSSKFGIQALVFLSLVIFILSGNHLPLLATLNGLLIAVLLTKGKILSQLREQKKHLIWFFKENLTGNKLISDRNSFVALFKKNNHHIKSYFVEVIYRALCQNSYTAVIIKLPIFLICIVGFIHYTLPGNTLEIETWITAVIAAAILFLLINIRQFLFLGEAERYLNHVAIFICLFAVEFVNYSHLLWLLILVVSYGFIFWAVEVLFLERFRPAHYKLKITEGNEIIQDLSAYRGTARVMCYPYSAAGGTFRVILETGSKVLYPLYVNEEFSKIFNEKYNDGFPHIKLSEVDSLSENYGVNYLIIYKADLIKKGISNWIPSARWQKKDIAGSIFDVYELKKESLM